MTAILSFNANRVQLSLESDPAISTPNQLWFDLQLQEHENLIDERGRDLRKSKWVLMISEQGLTSTSSEEHESNFQPIGTVTASGSSEQSSPLSIFVKTELKAAQFSRLLAVVQLGKVPSDVTLTMDGIERSDIGNVWNMSEVRAASLSAFDLMIPLAQSSL